MNQKIAPIKIGNTVFDFSRTYIFGILNVTPDSFSDGGQYLKTDEALTRIESMLKEGADVIDIGAESTRPGAVAVSSHEEINRLKGLIPKLKSRFDVPFSLDTRWSKTAAFGLENGIDLINDVSGMTDDRDMVNVLSKYRSPIVLMHKQGSPESMQNNVHYTDFFEEIKSDLKSKIDVAEGVGLSTIIIDPGIGFGKNVEHNLQLINQLDKFSDLGMPILIGTSRKSFIGKVTGRNESHFPGTLTSNVVAVMKGAHFIRVHDIKESKQALQMVDAIKGS
jgi:dihydropteroate synthase